MVESGKKSNVREQIDENLRRVYREALEEELPKSLTSLLDRLRAQEREAASGRSGSGNGGTNEE